MNESEFISEIDCNFPYTDRQKASRLIALACQISPNAAFAIADELARPPFRESEEIEEILLLDLLGELEGKFDHPIKGIIFDICRKMIKRQPISVDETLEALGVLKDFPGEYSAASIAYFSCDDDPGMEVINTQYQELIHSWKDSGLN